jgi:glycosyltransferase involved in cell wall biosynthesis
LALIFVAIFSINIKLKDMASITTKLIGINKTKDLNWSQNNTKQLLKIFHNNMDLVIAVSRKVQKQLLKDGVTSRVEVIPTGVDPLPSTIQKVNAFRKKWSTSNNDIVILYAGRLSIEKNLDLLLDSFCEVAGNHSNIKLLFVGDFNYKKQLEEKVADTPYDKRIIFTGRVKRDELGTIYQAADIFAFPSLTDTQALVLNEAACAGLPIVWCDKDVNEVVVDGKNGILAKPNTKSFSKALERLIIDQKLRQKYSEFGKQNAQKFSEKNMSEKFNKQLIKIISD